MPTRITIKPYVGEVSVADYRSHPRYKGCVGHWLMGEGGGTTIHDLSGYGNNGATQNLNLDADWVLGKFGPALNFDGPGDESVDIADASVLSLLHHSFSFWMQVDVDAVSEDIWVFEKQGTSDWFEANYDCLIDNTSPNKLTVGWFDGTSFINLTETIDLAGLGWQHVVGTYDKVTQRLYRNGVEVNSAAETSTPLVSTGIVRIGAGVGTASNLNGQMDDVRLYNRALLPAEVWSLYTDPFLEFQIEFNFAKAAAAAAGSGAISLAGEGGLAGMGGLAGPHGGLVG